MIDYTHRDRRAQRDVDRALATLAAAIAALTGLALLVPLPVLGLGVVVALGVAGAIYLGWSERLLSTYSSDLRLAREGRAADGFLRAEVASAVGLDREADGPRVPSPHTRRRPPGMERDETPRTRDGP